MEILSEQQHAAFREGRIPAVEEFAEGTWVVPMGLPGKFPGGVQAYSFAYVLDDSSGGLHVVDPGWDLADNIRRWDEFFTLIGRSFSDVGTVTVTHLHHDHIGLAHLFSQRSGAPVVMNDLEARVLDEAAGLFEAGDAPGANRVSRVYAAMTKERLEAFGVPRDHWQELTWLPEEPAFPRADRRLSDGELLPITGRSIRTIHTPGHTGGHIALVEEASGIIFTADHVLPGINPGLGLGGPSPTNPIADYFTSLERMTQYDAYIVAPGHEYFFRGLAQRAEALKTHHLKRTREVAAAMDQSRTVWEIAQEVTWSDGFSGLRGYKLSSALSQVAMHMEYVSG